MTTARNLGQLSARDALARLGDPRRTILAGVLLSAAFFIGFLGWASWARLDAAVQATGVVEVAGRRQSVQHPDGGTVADILVREGDRVRRGQILIRLAAADVRAQERAQTAQAIRLLAQRARLEAEQGDTDVLRTPPEFSMLSDADRSEALAALEVQRRELEARRATLGVQRAALSQRAQQSASLGDGYREQASSSDEQLRLLDQQLNALRPVAARGFVSQTRLRELERARAQLLGQKGQYAASIAQMKGAELESRLNAMEATRSFAERAALDLREVDVRLGDLMPKLAAVREQLAKTEIRAPATGAVIGMTIFTPGGVVAAGQRLMDVVPEAVDLRIDARLTPEDADDVVPGQRTLLKFSGLHRRDVPDIVGEVSRVSADAISDERTGTNYFTAEITVRPDQLAVMRRVIGDDFALKPGMPVQVMIPLRARTMLDYLVEPLIGSFWTSFHEN